MDTITPYITTSDDPVLVFEAPYFNQINLSDALAPAIDDYLAANLPIILPPYIDPAAEAAVQNIGVLRAGDTMQGHLYTTELLPVDDSELVTKLYVDTEVAGSQFPEAPAGPPVYGRNAGNWLQVLPLSGGTMAGPITFTVTGASTAATLSAPTVANNTFYLDYAAPHPAVMRLGDRVTIGATNNYNLVSDTGNPTYTWVSTIYHNGYFERDATLSAVSDSAGFALYGAARASDWKNTAGFPQAYGVAGFGVADAPGSVGDGAYFEGHVDDATSTAIACETMTVNTAGPPPTVSPYIVGALPASTGFAAGIGAAHQYTTIYDGSAAFVVNALPGQTAAWRRGILFGATGLSGTNGADSGIGIAINMARNHALQWDASASVVSALIWSRATGQAQQLVFDDTGFLVRRTSDYGTLMDVDMTGAVTLGNGITTNGASNMLGGVTIGYATSNTAALTINGADTSYRAVYFNGGGTGRWDISVDPIANGANFNINAYDTAGNYLSSPLTINRTTGTVRLNDAVVAGGTIDGTTVGASASANGTFQTLQANGLLFFVDNSQAVPPAMSGGGLAWNYIGGLGENNYWNLFGAAVVSHAFMQRTAGGAATRLMDISPAGNVTAHAGFTVNGSGPTIRSGTGAPLGTDTQPAGSLWLRTDGTGPHLYVSAGGGSWTSVV